MNRTIYIAFIIVCSLISCKEEKIPFEYRGKWQFARTFPLTNVDPVSITGDGSHLYIASGLKTEVHKMNYDGGLVEQIKNIRKPKYINILGTGAFVVAESEAKVASIIKGQSDMQTIPTNLYLDLPYSVSVEGNNIAITDFTKNVVYYNKAGQILPFGSTGNGKGQFNNPTDIQIHNEKIYVADSKNNRVQVFDKDGKPIRIIGEKEGIKTAGGIYVNDFEIIVTDYVGNRILVYDHKGNLKQELADNLDRPSDVHVRGREMFVTNYANNTVTVMIRK